MLFLALLRKGGSHVTDILCLNGSLLDLYVHILMLFQFVKFVTCQIYMYVGMYVCSQCVQVTSCAPHVNIYLRVMYNWRAAKNEYILAVQ